jgi:hypothetical protein
LLSFSFGALVPLRGAAAAAAAAITDGAAAAAVLLFPDFAPPLHIVAHKSLARGVAMLSIVCRDSAPVTQS